MGQEDLAEVDLLLMSHLSMRSLLFSKPIRLLYSSCLWELLAIFQT